MIGFETLAWLHRLVKTGRLSLPELAVKMSLAPELWNWVGAAFRSAPADIAIADLNETYTVDRFKWLRNRIIHRTTAWKLPVVSSTP